jgi:hypothetical protein
MRQNGLAGWGTRQTRAKRCAPKGPRRAGRCLHYNTCTSVAGANGGFYPLWCCRGVVAKVSAYIHIRIATTLQRYFHMRAHLEIPMCACVVLYPVQPLTARLNAVFLSLKTPAFGIKSQTINGIDLCPKVASELALDGSGDLRTSASRLARKLCALQESNPRHFCFRRSRISTK